MDLADTKGGLVVEGVVGLFQAFGISAPAGLNAYLTLLTVGLMARATDLIKLNKPYDLLANEWVLLTLATLLLVEIFVDKIPGVDTINDAVSTVIRPVAGAILFASTNNVFSDINPVLALVAGLTVAGGVHAVKATARPVVTASTGGLGNAFVSVAEDVTAAGVTIIAIVLPVVGVIVFLVLLGLFLWWLTRKKRQRPAHSSS